MLTGSDFMFGFDSVPKTGFLLKTISVYLSINRSLVAPNFILQMPG